MKVFLSWSGRRSKAVAAALREWLPSLFPTVDPFISDTDIDAGSRGLDVIANELKDTRFGIVCLTPENLAAPWVLFEAGALSKMVGASHVAPYLNGMRYSDVTGPLAQFQSCDAGQDGTLKLVRSLNKAMGDGGIKNESALDRAFQTWWPQLAEVLDATRDLQDGVVKPRESAQVLEEILGLVRAIHQAQPSPVDWTKLVVSYPKFSHVVPAGSGSHAVPELTPYVLRTAELPVFSFGAEHCAPPPDDGATGPSTVSPSG